VDLAGTGGPRRHLQQGHPNILPRPAPIVQWLDRHYAKGSGPELIDDADTVIVAGIGNQSVHFTPSIAAAAGFGTATSMRQHLHAELGVSPATP
jgi:hypothetical protein